MTARARRAASGREAGGDGHSEQAVRAACHRGGLTLEPDKVLHCVQRPWGRDRCVCEAENGHVGEERVERCQGQAVVRNLDFTPGAWWRVGSRGEM